MRYHTIVADPPWDVLRGPALSDSGFGKTADLSARALSYPTMPTADIMALPVGALAERDAHLYLWTINAYINTAYDVVRSWGFKPSTLITWVKTPMGSGLGGTWGITTEHVLFARRGTLKATGRVNSTWHHWKRGEHSAKPEAFLDLVESVSPGPYLELFARRNRIGWDTWGNEALEHVQVGT